MANHTPNLDLLKKNPATDGNDTFNIETMLNENWDKIDVAVGQVKEEIADIEIPLSDATNGTRSNVAASEKAVGLVMQAANAANLAAGAAQTTANAAETPTGAQNKVSTHANLTTAHGAVSAATANRMIVRDGSGRAKVAAPSASDDIAIKSTVDNAVGTLSTLLTTDKGNAVAAINELFTSASNGKTAVAAAITGKGVPATGSDTFAQLATKIGQITVGSIANVNEKYSDIYTAPPIGSPVVKDFFTFPANTKYALFIAKYQGGSVNTGNKSYVDILLFLVDKSGTELQLLLPNNITTIAFQSLEIDIVTRTVLITSTDDQTTHSVSIPTGFDAGAMKLRYRVTRYQNSYYASLNMQGKFILFT